MKSNDMDTVFQANKTALDHRYQQQKLTLSQYQHHLAWLAEAAFRRSEAAAKRAQAQLRRAA